MKKIFLTIFAVLCVTVMVNNHAYAQKGKLQTIESVVLDQNGNPVANAGIYSGRYYAKTDESGKFTITTERNAKLVIEADGYDAATFSAEEVNNGLEIKLLPTGFLYGGNEEVELAFRDTKKAHVVGAVTVIKPSDIEDYDHNIFAQGLLNGRTMGLLGNNSIRGIGIGIDVASLTGSGLRSGNALFVVDGLPRELGYLRASEIESITVLKDVNSAILYGSAAVNGVVMVTTKRGEAFKDKTRFSANYGISQPKAYPKFLNSADYFTYYNQARINDGLEPTYSAEDIENYRTGNKYRYPSVDYFSDEYLRPFSTFSDINGEFSGGNDNAKFYTNVGWNSSGGQLKFGEGANASNNIFNARGNVDLKVSDWINTSIDGSALFVIDKDTRGNYWSDAATLRPHLYTPLIPINLVNPEDPELKARKNDVDGIYLLGGTKNEDDTPFGDGYSGGTLERIERNFGFNNRVDVDLGSLAEGLTFHTNVSFDYYMRYNQIVANSYAVYQPTWSATGDTITSLEKIGVDARPGTQTVGNSFFIRRFGFYGKLSYDKELSEKHHVSGSLFGYGSNYKYEGSFQGVKQAHMGVQMSYVYNNRYMVDFSGAFVNSVKLPDENKIGFSPSLGLAWMISSEDFLSSVSAIDYLKLRLTGGIINTDLPIEGFFYHDEQYSNSGSYNWNEGARSRSGVAASWLTNKNLNYSKRKELNIGMEGMFFNRTIGFETNVFYDVYSDLVTRVLSRYPSFLDIYLNSDERIGYIPYENYEKDAYRGVEAGLSFNKTFGNLGVSIGVNGLFVTSERTTVDEVYDNEYQYREGRPRDATFGLEAIGLFQSQQEINDSPLQAFGAVVPGDIKYKDQNGDGIVDGNDEVFLRRWQAPLSGGIQIKLSYKDFSIYALGEGRRGAKNFMEGNYYWVDGNKKYSELVLDSWTPDNTDATYPRLSSGTNSNNNRRSSYWLYKDDYFSLRKVQLNYRMPESITRSLRMKDLNVYVDGWNLVQFAENKEIRELNVGYWPQMSSFSIGLRTNF